MPYIIVEFGGQQTFGGYLMVDGGRRIKLVDVIKLIGQVCKK